MRPDEELELSGMELYAEHTGRTCDAPVVFLGRERYCDRPSGHGGLHLSRSHAWWDSEADRA